MQDNPPCVPLKHHLIVPILGHSTLCTTYSSAICCVTKKVGWARCTRL
jgi:hypothetical protein